MSTSTFYLLSLYLHYLLTKQTALWFKSFVDVRKKRGGGIVTVLLLLLYVLLVIYMSTHSISG